MEQFGSAASIQKWLPDPPEHNPTSRTHDNLISSAFHCILSNFAKLVKRLRAKCKSQELRPLIDALRNELERLYLWGQGLSFKTLELLFDIDDELSLSVLARLYELGTAILKSLLPAVTEICAPALEEADLRFFEYVLEGLLQTLQQKDEYAIDYSLPPKLEDEVAGMRAAVDDIQVLLDCLMDLALAIEDMFKDVLVKDEAENLNQPEVENFVVSSVPAHVYCGRIRDRFRNAPKWLVERLGEANAGRSEWILSRQPKEERAFAVIETEKQTVASTESASENVFSNFTGTSSVTASDKVFDTAALGIPSGDPIFKTLAREEDTQSVLSFSSTGTTQSAVQQGRARVPPLPKGASEGYAFNCLACSERVVITSRSAWRQHIFKDLKPYTCTIRDCSWNDRKPTSSSLAWEMHENTHRGERWVAEICPLCADSSVTYTTQRLYFTHLGKHLREIALAAMPTLQHEYEEESYSEPSDIDGDVDLLPGGNQLELRHKQKPKRPRDRSNSYDQKSSIPATSTRHANSPTAATQKALETIDETTSQHDTVIRDTLEGIAYSHRSATRDAPVLPAVSASELEVDLSADLSHSTQDLALGPINPTTARPGAISADSSSASAVQEPPTDNSRQSISAAPAGSRSSDPWNLSSANPDFFGSSDQQIPGSYSGFQMDSYYDLNYNQNYGELFDPQSSYNFWGGDLGGISNASNFYPPYEVVDPPSVSPWPSTSVSFDDIPFLPMPSPPPPSNTDQKPQQSPPQDPPFMPSQLFVCREPGCIAKGFKRKADFQRHMDNTHNADSNHHLYACDYERCSRHKDPFRRRDHYRDHLRNYHGEDLSRRNEASEGADWFSSRSVSKDWWRCVRCLERVSVDEHETECPRCKVNLSRGRRKARGLDAQDSTRDENCS